MALFGKDNQSLDDLRLHCRQSFYNAEWQIVKAQIGAATKREEFKNLDKIAKSVKCRAIAGSIEEADEGKLWDNELNAAFAGLVQATGRCEIACHGTLATALKSPHHDNVVALHATDAEGAADKSHSTVALGKSANCRVAI